MGAIDLTLPCFLFLVSSCNENVLADWVSSHTRSHDQSGGERTFSFPRLCSPPADSLLSLPNSISCLWILLWSLCPRTGVECMCRLPWSFGAPFWALTISPKYSLVINVKKKKSLPVTVTIHLFMGNLIVFRSLLRFALEQELGSVLNPALVWNEKAVNNVYCAIS